MIIDIPKVKVLYRDRPVGTLQLDPTTGACVFEYDRVWLAEGFSISPTELPLQGGLFYADKEKLGGGFAVFEDSIPDGYGLYLLERILNGKGTSLRDLTPLQRLSIIGTSGMGALSYLPMMPGIHRQQELDEIERLDMIQEEHLGPCPKNRPVTPSSSTITAPIRAEPGRRLCSVPGTVRTGW